MNHRSSETTRIYEMAAQTPILQPADEYALAKRWLERGDKKAGDTIAKAHLRLVNKIARKFSHKYNVPMLELVSEGYVGLMQALGHFEPDRGWRFSTYATWWIRAAITGFITHSPLVKCVTTANQRKLFFRFKQALKTAGVLDSSKITSAQISEVAKLCGVPPSDVITMMHSRASPVSLYTPMNSREDEHGDVLLDRIEDESPSPEDMVLTQRELDRRRTALQEALNTLNKRERCIFEKRRLSETPSTLEALKDDFNISRERVRQIEVRALEKVSEILRGNPRLA